MRTHRLGAESDPRAEHQRQRQAGNTRVDVDRGATGEVEYTEPVGQPAAVEVGAGELVEGEDPTGDREVDQDAPQDGEQRPTTEGSPISDRARDQGHRDDREAGLEGDESQSGNGACGSVRAHDLSQPREIQRVAKQTDEVSLAESARGNREPHRVAERHAVAEQHPEHTNGAHADETHHDHV